MAIFATTAYGHFGDWNYRGVLSFWNDDTLIAHHDLGNGSDGWSVFGYNISLSITPDGEYVCATRGQGLPELGGYSESRVYHVPTGTYKPMPMLRDKNKHGPTINVVRWSPRGYFISGFGDYAYDPYNDVGVALPGASPEALVPDYITYGEYNGFSVLPVHGLLIEAVANNVEAYNGTPIVKDLFTGRPVTPPSGMVGLPWAGRPCSWLDTPTTGLLYRRIDPGGPNLTNTRTRVINTMTGKTVFLPSYSLHLARAVNGDLFQGTRSPYSGYLVHDDGTKAGVLPSDMPYLNSGSVESNIAFTRNNYFFASNPPSSKNPPSFGLVGQRIRGVPPVFISDYSKWLPFQVSDIQNVQSATVFINPIALDGQFWTNRRYTNETILYE